MLITILTLLHTSLPNFACFNFISRLLGRLEAKKEKRSVYILTSFIEAHEHAQNKIHAFVGMEEDESFQETASQLPSPEEIRVKSESERAVRLFMLSFSIS